MQPVSDQTVLGNFNDVEVEHHGQRSRFFRRDGKYFVQTAGPDGKQQDFAIAYTFGVYPLQQYLIAQPRGRLQAFGVAWDARAKEEGGQRWYHLYPEAPPVPGESVHWTGRDQNWNFMCASCHSTGIKKNYDLGHDSFRTTWSEINVACESCHGPGSAHVAWAQGTRIDRPPGLGLMASTMIGKGMSFGFSESGQKIASLHGKTDQMQRANETCLACHTRRQELVRDQAASAGESFLDQYLPSLIEMGLYHADGQIDGEVFEGGSYAQSAMHRAGVACINCHEPHTAKLRAEGNALCLQCHLSTYYDREAHHHHPTGSTGAQCINCHMPSKIYMGVHVRRDHSLRIPRPDLSVRFGTPNACTQCHKDKNPVWATDAIKIWLASKPSGGSSADAAFISAIAAAWRNEPNVDRLLRAVQNAKSGILKASLLPLLPPQDSPQQIHVLEQSALDSDGIVRMVRPEH